MYFLTDSLKSSFLDGKKIWSGHLGEGFLVHRPHLWKGTQDGLTSKENKRPSESLEGHFGKWNTLKRFLVSLFI